MTRTVLILVTLLCTTAALRADLTMEQRIEDDIGTNTLIVKIQGNMMRMDQPEQKFSVIVDLQTRNSFTLLTATKQFLRRFGSEVHWEMDEERKITHGTNEMDKSPARAVDTGRAEMTNGYNCAIFTWVGARGLKEKLWVAPQYPNYKAIQAELFKLDQFNDSGPHRNLQPLASLLPGMVVQSEAVIKGRTKTTTLVSASTNALDGSLFQVPKDYTEWIKPAGKGQSTNSPPAPQ